ncbi:MAG: YdcF family protein [Cyanobacteria bacterium P01_F01_bin.150]
MLYRLKRYRKMWVVFTITIFLVLLSFIPVRLTLAHLLHPTPDTILTLGGGIVRETFTAQFAQLYPEMNIWVSTGSPNHEAQEIFRAAGIDDHRVYLDRRAIDTVTNFTSLVHEFRARNINHVYMITSDFHMRRSQAIAFFVLGSQGIAFTPVAIPSDQPDESLIRVARDVGRSLLWIATGHTGASLHPQLRT